MKRTALKRAMTAAALTLALLQYQGIASAAPTKSAATSVTSAIGGQKPPGGANGFMGLLKQVQDLIAQVKTVAEDAKSELQSQMGELWSSVSKDLKLDDVMGELGQFDPQKLREEMMSQIEEVKGMVSDLPNMFKIDGIESVANAGAISQKTLGTEGQRQTQTNLKNIVEVAADSASFVKATTDLSKTDAETADDADKLSKQVDQDSQSADKTLRSIQQQANQAESATSSQDVLKILSQQTAGNGSILATLSSQLGANGNQIGGLSNQLASNSAQNVNMASLQSAEVQLTATQATTLETMKQQGAATVLTLNELHEMERGNRQAELIAAQAPADRLAQINQTSLRFVK